MQRKEPKQRGSSIGKRGVTSLISAGDCKTMTSLLCREARPSRREDDIRLELDKLGGNLGKALVAPIRPPILDRHGTSIDPA